MDTIKKDISEKFSTENARTIDKECEKKSLISIMFQTVNLKLHLVVH